MRLVVRALPLPRSYIMARSTRVARGQAGGGCHSLPSMGLTGNVGLTGKSSIARGEQQMSIESFATVIPVPDLHEAVAFWQQLLGTEPTFVDGDRWAQFDVGGRRISLAGADRFADAPSVMLRSTISTQPACCWSPRASRCPRSAKGRTRGALRPPRQEDGPSLSMPPARRRSSAFVDWERRYVEATTRSRSSPLAQVGWKAPAATIPGRWWTSICPSTVRPEVVVAFVHGCSFRSGHRCNYDFLPAPYVANGVGFASIGYRLAPREGAR